MALLHQIDKTGMCVRLFKLPCNKRDKTQAGSTPNTNECVVPENIQTPTTEGIGNSGGVGGSMVQEIPKGRGVSKADFS